MDCANASGELLPIVQIFEGFWCRNYAKRWLLPPFQNKTTITVWVPFQNKTAIVLNLVLSLQEEGFNPMSRNVVAHMNDISKIKLSRMRQYSIRKGLI
jgi:hypothetical protein